MTDVSTGFAGSIPASNVTGFGAVTKARRAWTEASKATRNPNEKAKTKINKR